MPAIVTRCLLAMLLLALCLPAAAQAPDWQSARAVAVATAAASNNFSTVTATAADAVGNVYLAGNFRNSVVLGSTTLVSLGENDIFVAKFNPATNQFVWAQRAGGKGYDVVNALAVNKTSVYMTGSFSGSIASFGTLNLANAELGNLFVAKLLDAGSRGSFVWVQQAGGTFTADASALAVSGSSVYIAGYFHGPTASFGPATLANAGFTNIFVAKLTDAGSTSSFVWAQRAGGTGVDGATALAVSGTSVYVAGYFNSPTATFGSATLTNAGGNDVFAARLTDAGNTGRFVWAQRAGGPNKEQATALAVSGTTVYITGYFGSSTVDFGPATLTSAGSTDLFVAKLTDAGRFVWAQRAGGRGVDIARTLAVSGANLYVAGDFRSPTADFGPATLTNALNTDYSPDVFVAKLTDDGSTGRFVWAQSAGGIGIDQATAFAVSGTSVYVAGHFFESPTTSFGAITLANPKPSPYLGFLASLVIH